MSKDIQTLLEEQGKLLNELRDTEEQRQAEIKQHGEALGETTAKIDKIEADLTTVMEAIDAKAKALSALRLNGGDDIDPENHRANAVKFFSAKAGKPRVDVTDEDVASYRAYRNRFLEWVSRGDIRDQQVLNELSVGSDPDGGYWVPTETQSEVTKRIHETSPIREVARVLSISTDSIELPYQTDKAGFGGWVHEKATRSESATPQVGIQRITTGEQYAEPHATQKVLDDAAIDVEGWLSMEIGDELGRRENTAFVTGTGIEQPKGILEYGSASVTTADASRDWGILQYVASGKAGAFADTNPADKLLDLIGELNPFYSTNARFMMARRTYVSIAKFKDGDGNYLFNTNLQAPSIFGFPVTYAEDFPAVGANTYSIAFGDFFRGYTILDRMGIRVLRDPFTSKPFVKFYTTRRVGGDVTNFDAIKLMKFAAS